MSARTPIERARFHLSCVTADNPQRLKDSIAHAAAESLTREEVAQLMGEALREKDNARARIQILKAAHDMLRHGKETPHAERDVG